jgi:hypothetical protein
MVVGVQVLGQAVHAEFAEVVCDRRHLGAVHVGRDRGDDDEAGGATKKKERESIKLYV